MRIKINIGYKNFYLYSAINPKNGDQFTLLLPSVNILCMNIFLSAFIKQNPDKQILMIMDGAAWHQSKRLTKYQGLKTLIQPPYSPELNPVERLWQQRQNHQKQMFYIARNPRACSYSMCQTYN